MLHSILWFIIKNKGVFYYMANRQILDSSLRRNPMIVSVQSHIRDKIIQLAIKSNKSYSQYVEELFMDHLKEKGIL
jgi:hypothetical protein